MDTVIVDRRGAELRITLNRPDALNAWDKQFGIELLAAVQQAADDDAVRAVVITGAGRAFSSGADLKAGFDPTPVLAAVNGPAVGIGCSLALCCDLIVARESAYFLLAFINIGLVPDGGSSVLLPERIGFTRAAEMAMLGERVSARRALEWGLVNSVTSDDGFDATVDELAGRLAGGPTRAYAGVKTQLNEWLFARMDAQLELEASIQERAAASGDFLEGVQAFLERRPAAFGGR